MKDITSYIDSGILESYVLGLLSDAESAEICSLIDQYPEIREEVEAICLVMEQLAFSHSKQPDPTIKPFLMATLDYTQRLENGETPSFPPTLHENSTIEDYAEWINRPDMQLNGELKDVHAKIIGYTAEQITTIIWIKHMAPPEIHTDEYEKFLILEGTCDIQIGDELHHLKSGDYLTIPLHVNHFVKVTSSIPCKAILQRIAA